MEELMTSCDFLDSALERYYKACVALELEVYHNFAQADLYGLFLKDLGDKLSKSNSYQHKLRRCEMTLHRIRNHSPSIAPINALPPEVLTRIFNMLHSSSCCFGNRKSSQISVPLYPDTLSQVCSRWRRIAIGERSLWSHIDLSPSSNNNLEQRLLSRGMVFASRSDKLLNIHIGGDDGNSENLAKFCATIATRVRSLEVFSPDAVPFKNVYTPVLDACFMRCAPGTLGHLAIWGRSNRFSSILFPEADRYPDVFTTLTGAARRRLDELLLGIQVLHLGINCIPPTSRAYHGLVELSLMGSQISITETHFLGILAASPKLRVLNLDLSIREASQSPSRVQLDELEVLFLSWVEDRSNLVRLLCPGAQPLKLILEARNRLSMSRATATDFIHLLERSMVTELYVHQVKGTPGCGEILFNPFQLLKLTPHLRTLALSDASIKQPSRWLVQKSSISSSVTSPPPLHTLHLIETSIDWTSCLNLVQSHGVQKITISNCTLYTEARAGRIQSDQEVIRGILASICPTTQILSGSILELAGVYDENRDI
ncbi:hypothetical protein B0J17DRAFT_647360 [Rhizoctonia solani]|nr:hypothetical protein B0J17DRAFT_647360 [Rhizoctonia solani]